MRQRTLRRHCVRPCIRPRRADVIRIEDFAGLGKTVGKPFRLRALSLVTSHAEPLAGRLCASGAEALLDYERQHGQSRVTGAKRRGGGRRTTGCTAAFPVLERRRQPASPGCGKGPLRPQETGEQACPRVEQACSPIGASFRSLLALVGGGLWRLLRQASEARAHRIPKLLCRRCGSWSGGPFGGRRTAASARLLGPLRGFRWLR
jgi:hypothetical protein